MTRSLAFALFLLPLGCGDAADARRLLDTWAPTDDVDSGATGDVGSAESEPPAAEDVGPPTEDARTPSVDAEAPDVLAANVAASSDCLAVSGKAFGGHCYFVADVAAFATARGACKAKGAHLVTITSSAEQAFVAGLTSTDTWIGLERVSGKLDTWVTGEPVGYALWAPGEPNGSGSCVRLRSDHLWGDNNCSLEYPAICERETP